MTTKMQWSDEQHGIFNWFATGTGSLLVRARAGTGKTTTIIEGIHHAPNTENILLCAFNKKIAVELEERLDHPNAKAMTLHSAGFRVVRDYWPKVRLEDRNGERAFALAEEAADGGPDAMVRLIAKLHSRGREMSPLTTQATWTNLEPIAWEHDCVPDGEWEDSGWTVERVCKAAAKAMELAKRKPTTGIDFSDMLFLPVANKWLAPRYSLVVVDEAQDMNACQLIIARRLCKGRLCIVGDDRQAIYGFRGADSDALDRMKRELSASELSLTTTYRCAKLVVAQAKHYVMDYSAAEQNPDGLVRTIAVDTVLTDAKPSDVILSRLNAPLVSLCLRALRAGIPARVEGRDVAAGLKKMVKDLAKGKAKNSIPAFLARLDAWEQREVGRAKKTKNSEAKVSTILDKCDTLRAVAEGAKGISELTSRIETIFASIQSGKCITLSSVHKAKGLEWERVFVLADTFRDGDEDNPEEDNIRYVAYTRAKTELVFCIKDVKLPEPEQEELVGVSE